MEARLQKTVDQVTNDVYDQVQDLIHDLVGDDLCGLLYTDQEDDLFVVVNAVKENLVKKLKEGC